MLVYLSVDVVRESLAVVTWSRAGLKQSNLNWTDDGQAVFATVVPEDFGGPPYPVSGDTLLSLAGSLSTRERYQDLFETIAPARQPIVFEFRHQGETLASAFRMDLPPPALQWHLAIVEILRFLTCIAFLIVGYWALSKRAQSAVVRIFTLYCFAAAAMMVTHYEFFPPFYATLNLPGWSVLDHLLADLGLLLTALWLHLQLRFPRPLPLLQRYWPLVCAVCYAPSVAAIIAHNTLQYGFAIPFEAGPVIRVFVFGQIIASIAIPIYRYLTTENHLERRQLRLIVWGSGTGLTINFLMVAASNYFPAWYFARMSRDLNFSTVSFLALLLGPLSFSYAFGRYRLLDIEARVRRSTRKALVTAALLLVLAGLVYLIGELLLVRIGVTSRAPTLIIAIALTLGMLPAQRKLHRVMEERIYPERQRLRRLMDEFLQRASSQPDQNSFWMELESRLCGGLQVRHVLPVLKFQDTEELRCRSIPTVFASSSALLTEITRRPEPLLVDEAAVSQRIALTDAELRWLEERRIGLILPLVVRGSLIGFLAVGTKATQEDYDAEELQLLSSLSSQIAMVCENLRLLEENVIKQHLEEQLQMARRIQLGFLPQNIPDTPGLEIAAACRFCLEVAGDYHDVIPLADRQSALAIGDVAGKGVGAALLMANLQASLRSTIGTGLPLETVVQKINELIFHNTSAEQYITFFAGVYDPGTSQLTYVNAGHNCPLIISPDGSVKTLDVGGLILGCRPVFSYESARIGFQSGDLLVMYTDGVSEAANDREELFGDERIQKLVMQQRNRPLPEILQSLEREVIYHHGSELFEDDFTLLMARAL